MTPFGDLAQVATLASHALGRVQQLGAVGVATITIEETAAMACLLHEFGLRPVQPLTPHGDPK